MKNDSKVDTMNFCDLLLIYFLLITLGSNVVPTTTIQNLEVEESTFKNNDTDETDFELSIINVDIPSLQTATNESVIVDKNDKTLGIDTSTTVDLDTEEFLIDNTLPESSSPMSVFTTSTQITSSTSNDEDKGRVNGTIDKSNVTSSIGVIGIESDDMTSKQTTTPLTITSTTTSAKSTTATTPTTSRATTDEIQKFDLEDKDIEIATITGKVPITNTEEVINVENSTKVSTSKTMPSIIQIQDEIPEFGIEEFDYDFEDDIITGMMQMNSITTPVEGLTDGSNLVTGDINKSEVTSEDSKEILNFSEASSGMELITFAFKLNW